LKCLENTKTVFGHKEKEDAETEIASGVYKESNSELKAFFKRHRNQTSILFKKNPEIKMEDKWLEKLGFKQGKYVKVE